MVVWQIVLEVLLGEGVDGGVVGLELLEADFGGVEVEVGGAEDRGDDQKSAEEGEDAHVEILWKKIRFLFIS